MSSAIPTVGTDLTLKPVQTSKSAGKKPALQKGDLAPWTCEYLPSGDGKDENLLIMFHGLGEGLACYLGSALTSLRRYMPIILQSRKATQTAEHSRHLLAGLGPVCLLNV